MTVGKNHLTAHQLAKKLLEMPDKPVYTTYYNKNFDCLFFQDVSEVHEVDAHENQNLNEDAVVLFNMYL